MFCPKCGTQNPDTAQVCQSCRSQLSAPKYKGTIMMVNPPAGVPAAPAAVSPPGGGPLPPQAPAAPVRSALPGAASGPSKLKGTMVGVAPPMAGGGAPSPVAVPPAAGMGGAAPSPFGDAAAPPPQAAYSPQVPQQNVNPLGGTMAADANAFASFGSSMHHQQPQAAPHPGLGGTQLMPGVPAPHGGAPAAPPQANAGFGTPAAAYGAPPGGPPGFGGAPAQQGYGAPPPGPATYDDAYGHQQPQAYYGQPPGQQQGISPYAPHGMIPVGAGGTLQSAGNVTTGPTRRNALMTLLMPMAFVFGGILFSIIMTIVAIVTGVGILGLVGSLVALGGCVYGFVLLLLGAIKMVGELKYVTRNDAFAWWPILIPIYNLVWLLTMLPAEVTKAKQLLGVQKPTQNIILYLFLWPYALATDINDMAR